MPDDHKTVIGPASGVQLSVLAMVIVGVAGGAMGWDVRPQNSRHLKALSMKSAKM